MKAILLQGLRGVTYAAIAAIIGYISISPAASESITLAVTPSGQITLASNNSDYVLYGTGEIGVNGFVTLTLNALTVSGIDDAGGGTGDVIKDAGGGTGDSSDGSSTQDAGGGTGDDAGGGTGTGGVIIKDAGGGTGGGSSTNDAGGGTGDDAGGGTGSDAVGTNSINSDWGYAEIAIGCGQADVIVYRKNSDGIVVEDTVTTVLVDLCLQ